VGVILAALVLDVLMGGLTGRRVEVSSRGG